MKKNILIVLLLLVTCSAIPVFAGTYYEKGNTFFSINAGVNIPAFVSFPNNEAEGSHVGMTSTHIKLGGTGSLAYQACINPLLAIGGEIGYEFNYVVDGKIFTQVPITAKATFIPVQTGKFDLNVVANLGINFIKYTSIRNLVPYASISVNPTVYITDNWGIGLNAGLSSMIELTKPSTSNAIYSSLPVILTVTYRR